MDEVEVEEPTKPTGPVMPEPRVPMRRESPVSVRTLQEARGKKLPSVVDVIKASSTFNERVINAKKFRNEGGLVIESEKIPKQEAALSSEKWEATKRNAFLELTTRAEKETQTPSVFEAMVDETVENPLALAQVTTEAADQCSLAIVDHDLLAWSALKENPKGVALVEDHARNIFPYGIDEEERTAIRESIINGAERARKGIVLKSSSELQEAGALPVGLNTINAALGVYRDTESMLKKRQYLANAGQAERLLNEKQLSANERKKAEDLTKIRAFGTILGAVQAEMAGKYAEGREAYAHTKEISAANFIKAQREAEKRATEKEERERVEALVHEVIETKRLLTEEEFEQRMRDRARYAQPGSVWRKKAPAPVAAS